MSGGSEGLNDKSADVSAAARPRVHAAPPSATRAARCRVQETRQSMQKKSFTAWANLHLNKQGEKVEDLKTDFCDGIKLIKLVEIIAEDDLGKYNKKPVSRTRRPEPDCAHRAEAAARARRR